VPTASSKSSTWRPSRVDTPSCATPSFVRRSDHQPKARSPAMRKDVREMLLFPRCSRAASGMSKIVMSEPGVPAPSPKKRWYMPGSSWLTVRMIGRSPSTRV
jgi:hypothetical protein